MKFLRASISLLAVVAACGGSDDSSATKTDAGSGNGGGGDASTSADGGASSGDGGASTGDAATTGYGKYENDGPASVTISSLQVTRPTTNAFTVSAYIPSTAGPHPVVILSSGFFQKALGYAAYAHRLASWGIVTILRDDPQLGEQTSDIVLDVSYEVTTWLAATNADVGSALHGEIDTTKIGLAGHSRGGQVSLLAAEAGAKGKITGVFGLDPVDSSQGGGAEARTSIASIATPLAFIGETTDGSGVTACAPSADNYEVLYGAAVSPAVAITAVNADHTMFEDPDNCTACNACTAGTADSAAVRDAAVRYMTAFFARELLADTSVGAAFDGAGIALDESAGLVTVESK